MRCTHESRHYTAAINCVTTWRNAVTSSHLEASRSTHSFSHREKVPAGRMRVRAPDQSSGKSNAHRTTALQKAAIKYVSACEARRLAVTSTQPNNCVHLAWRRGQKSVAKRVEGTASARGMDCQCFAGSRCSWRIWSDIANARSETPMLNHKRGRNRGTSLQVCYRLGPGSLLSAC